MPKLDNIGHTFPLASVEASHSQPISMADSFIFASIFRKGAMISSVGKFSCPSETASNWAAINCA
ncbi:hypothetical protein D3C87_1559210 [compost metagenome]